MFTISDVSLTLGALFDFHIFVRHNFAARRTWVVNILNWCGILPIKRLGRASAGECGIFLFVIAQSQYSEDMCSKVL